MKRALLLLSVLAVSVDGGHCQGAAAPRPAFEVASITPCKPGTPAPPGEHAAMVQFTFPGGRLEARATTIKYLFEWAYDILPSQHSPGPAWLDGDRYDIVAKAGRSAPDAEMKLMTQALLEDRFKLRFHKEQHEFPVLILTAGKTPPKLFPPKDGEHQEMKMAPQSGENQKIVSYHITATRFSFEQLNRTFARQLERVIVNNTGLAGDFDFSFDLSPDENRPNPLDPDLLIAALRDQLGFTVKAQKASVDYLVVDGIERPSGN